MNDTRIVTLLHARQESGLRLAEERYRKRMQSVAYNLLSSRQDAEECTNDALLDLWNTVPPGAPENVELYCIMLVRRRALDRLRYNRAQKRCATVLPLDELQETLCEPIPDDGELPAVLNTFLYALPDRDRRLFLQRYWLCRPIADIAADLHMHQGSVKSRLSRLRRRLAESLKERKMLHEK